MSCISNSSDINQTFIIEPLAIDDIYTTGATLINNIIYFDRIDALSAYTANLSSLVTYDTYVTGMTFSNNYLTISRNDGISISADINSFTGLTINGSLSATTFFGDGSNLTGITGVSVTDIYVTGSTFTPSNKTLTSTRTDNVNFNVILPVRTFLTASTTTSNNILTTIDTITGITNNSNVFIISYVNAFKDDIDYGFWKRTLAVNKVSGLVNIIGENSDFDRISSGMTPNSIIYSANSENILIRISGETAKSYTWTSNWEIIK